jgi:hypothetical protein
MDLTSVTDFIKFNVYFVRLPYRRYKNNKNIIQIERLKLIQITRIKIFLLLLFGILFKYIRFSKSVIRPYGRLSVIQYIRAFFL